MTIFLPCSSLRINEGSCIKIEPCSWISFLMRMTTFNRNKEIFSGDISEVELTPYQPNHVHKLRKAMRKNMQKFMSWTFYWLIKFSGFLDIEKSITVDFFFLHFKYSETLNNEYIGRIYQMSSWQFFNEFYTILRKFHFLRKYINSHEFARTVLKSSI